MIIELKQESFQIKQVTTKKSKNATVPPKVHRMYFDITGVDAGEIARACAKTWAIDQQRLIRADFEGFAEGDLKVMVKDLGKGVAQITKAGVVSHIDSMPEAERTAMLAELVATHERKIQERLDAETETEDEDAA